MENAEQQPAGDGKMKTRISRWMCVVNLSGLTGPVKVYLTTGSFGDSWWWDKTGDIGMKSGRTSESRNGYKAWLFKTKREADLFALGATKMGEIIKEVIG